MAEQMQGFNVVVKRMAIGYRTFYVHATSKREAIAKALALAPNEDWTATTDRSEYSEVSVRKYGKVKA